MALPESEDRDRVFIQKWLGICAALEHGQVGELDRVRELALKFGDFESLRECDFFSVRTRFSDELFAKVYFGTPHAAFRERILRALPNATVPTTWAWRPHANDSAANADTTGFLEYNLALGAFSDSRLDDLSPKMRDLFAALTADLYRPARVGALFSYVFKGEFFDIFHSPNRVHQLVWRLRGYLRHHRLGIRFVGDQGTLRLAVPPRGRRLTLIYPAKAFGEGQASWLWATFRAGLDLSDRIDVRVVQERLGISRSSAQRLLR